MIPIAMLAELQRVMAQNAAMAASASAPPGTLPFNPYELLAHGARPFALILSCQGCCNASCRSA